jgi:hypothetical protein
MVSMQPAPAPAAHPILGPKTLHRGTGLGAPCPSTCCTLSWHQVQAWPIECTIYMRDARMCAQYMSTHTCALST